MPTPFQKREKEREKVHRICIRTLMLFINDDKILNKWCEFKMRSKNLQWDVKIGK